MMSWWRWYLIGAFALVCSAYSLWGHPIPFGVWPFLLLMWHWAARHELVEDEPWDLEAELEAFFRGRP